METVIALWNMPKDWTPGGGLIWLVGLVLVGGITMVVTALQDRTARR